MRASWRSVAVLIVMACGAALATARVLSAPPGARSAAAGLGDEAALADLVACLSLPEHLAFPVLVLSGDTGLVVRLRYELYPRAVRQLLMQDAERLDRALTARHTLLVVALEARTEGADPAAADRAESAWLDTLIARLPGRHVRPVLQSRELLVADVGP